MASAGASSMTVRASPKRKPLSGLLRREVRWGFLFLSPWILGFFIFTLLPMAASLAFSVTNYNPIHPEDLQFVGLRNYARMFTDPFMRQAWGVTLRFVLISVPLSIAFPLALAVLVNSERLFAKNILRTLFYMPTMIPIVVNVIIWGGIMNSENGWLNQAIEFVFHVQGPRWYQDPLWVIPALTIMGFWGVGNTMLIMLAGLQNVPTELYDAAKVDGAGGIQRFFAVTLPMISPVIFYNLMLAVIGSFQYFVQAYIIGNGRGDPNGATMFYNLYLYRIAFNFLDMGYGATLAWAMFVVVLILTIIMWKSQRRWVYYAGGE